MKFPNFAFRGGRLSVGECRSVSLWIRHEKVKLCTRHYNRRTFVGVLFFRMKNTAVVISAEPNSVISVFSRFASTTAHLHVMAGHQALEAALISRWLRTFKFRNIVISSFIQVGP